MSRVLLTGGSGFLGRHLLPVLVERRYDVVATARSAAAAETVAALGATPIPCDLADAASVDDAFRASDADALITCSSLGDGHAPAIVAAAMDAGIARGLFVSSTAIFTTIDAPSKPRRTAGERVVTESPLDWTVIRPTMIYGAPGDRNIERLLHVLPKTPVLPVPGGGVRLQQPVHVDDLAVAIVNAIDRDKTVGQSYNLAGPAAMSFRSLLEHAGAVAGRRVLLVPIPLEPAIAAMRVYERLAPHPRLKAEQLERLSEDKAFDIDDARRDLDFAPRSFDDGLRAELAAIATMSDGGDTAVGDHFEEVAASWIGRYEARPSFQHRLEVVGRIVSETLDAGSPPARVLDVGGGPGVFSMVASCRADEVVCLDPSGPMVEAGARYESRVAQLASRFGTPVPARIRRVVGTIDALRAVDVEGDGFSLILAIAMLEYLDDPGAAIAEIAARLRPGGRLLLTVPNEQSWFRRGEDLVGSLGTTAGRWLGSERLRSRAYASTRPHGNEVEWRRAATRAGLFVERVDPLTLGADGVRRLVTASLVVVLRKV